MKNLFGKVSVKEDYSNAISDVVPGQAMDLTELWNRFNRGQRLLVNQRPINIYETDEYGNFIDPRIKDETLDNVMPDIEDPVDIEEYLEETNKIKEEIKKVSKKREEPKKEEPKKEELKKEEPKKEE